MQLQAREEPGPDWDAFVVSHPDATLGHAGAWPGILREAYGLRVHCLCARDATGDLAGVLPLAELRTLRGQRELVSLPFLDSAGILARDAAAERLLLDGALALARERGVKALELRQPAALRAGPEPSEQTRVDLVLPLEPTAEAQWQALRAKVRNQTRKAERSGLEPAPPGSALSRVRAFHEAFAVNMRDLGSPVHARRFFEVAARAFGERMEIPLAMLGERCVGGLVAIDFAGTVTAPWASTLREERARCPNNLIYWEALRWAIGRGAQRFDFGRSPRSGGTHRFKVGWGAREQSLAWTRLDASGALLTGAGSEASSLLRGLSRVWTRLPVPLATILGSRLRRHLAN